MSDGQGYPPVPPMPPGPPPGQPGQQGQPGPPQGGYPQQGGYPPPPAGYPQQQQQPGGFQEPDGYPYPQYSQYGHYQQYAQNPVPLGPDGRPPRGGRSKKVIGTWIAGVTGAVVASIVVAVVGFDDPTDKKDPDAQKPTSAPIVTGKVAAPSNTAAAGPKKADISNQLKIPDTLPPITGPKISGISVDPKTWPKACDLLTDDEIKSVIPEGTIRERKSFMGRYSNLLGKSVNDNECDITLDLPNQQSSDYPAKINVTTYGYKTPAEEKAAFAKEKTQSETATKAYPDQYDDIPADKIGVDGSFRDNRTVQISKNGFRVWVTLSAQLEDSQGNPLKSNTMVRQYGPSMAAVVGQKL
ncbi:hypothetical protein OG948_19490 [Embleya sp. NBC_00888]|uniref:hypothetical protein n=1 Tax=Embleya sp. NBC_00888 TaxID=2975960 RepID=UPI00386788E0|nr:hypothetical protein OG948_19490 [Embleya sp. NBC_00888]